MFLPCLKKHQKHSFLVYRKSHVRPKATGAVGMNILNNNEEVAGQTVFHAHVHLIPRYDANDEVTFAFTEHEPNFEALGKLAEQISQEVKA